jgi:hypothetical protein
MPAQRGEWFGLAAVAAACDRTFSKARIQPRQVEAYLDGLVGFLGQRQSQTDVVTICQVVEWQAVLV